MQRFLLLILSISLAVLVFLCSQRNFDMSAFIQDSDEIRLSSFQPFYYAAMQIVNSETGLNEGIQKFLEELQKQHMRTSDSLLIFQSHPQQSEKSLLVIATKIPESFSINSPLFKARWDWENVLIWEGGDKGLWEFNSEKLTRFLDEHHLFAIGPVIELFVGSSQTKRKFWLPVRREVGN